MQPFLLFYFFLIELVLADGVDWIDPQYVLRQRSHPNSELLGAIRSIVNRGKSSAKNGPWSVTKGSVVPPSGSKQDYLSWAPYHWPKCNWCKVNRGNHAQDSDLDDGSSGDTHNPTHHFSSPSIPQPNVGREMKEGFETASFITRLPQVWFQYPEQKDEHPESSTALASIPSALELPSADIPLSPDENAAGQKPTKTHAQACTPSPTKSMAASATWTMCPYEARDGQVNPDRNQLLSLPQLIAFSQSVVDNAIASVLDRNTEAAKHAASSIETFFIHPKTGVLPNLEWGQTLRGPNQRGSYMGILDFRAMVKVANAVQILRASESTHWTKERDSKLVSWTKSYIKWLETSELGKRVKKSVNNHTTFFYAQMAALKILVGDENGAIDAVQDYFGGPFKEQIVYSGEQPFESTRTRPYHYRCFNLEAMMTLAKMADYLGLNMWTAKTKYSSSIHTAVDYLMTLDPGQEDPRAALPIISSALATYGDYDDRRYLKFLEAGGAATPEEEDGRSYPFKRKSWWFYSQPDALKHSSAAIRRAKRQNPHQLYPYDAFVELESLPSDATMNSMPNQVNTCTHGKRELDRSKAASSAPKANSTPNEADQKDSDPEGDGLDWPESSPMIPNTGQVSTPINDPSVPPPMSTVIHPERPAPFVHTDAVELDEGVWVYWDEIRDLYNPPSKKRSVWARW